jgi:hypothetical protein
MKATNKGLAFIGSLSWGAGLMSIFDPQLESDGTL